MGRGPGWAWRRWGALLVAAPLGTIALIQFWFPGSGMFPFPWWLFVPSVVLAAACAAVLPPRERIVRVGLVLYVVACVGAFLVPSAMGANATRISTLVLGPIVVASDVRRRRATWLLLPAVLAWQCQAPIHDVLALRDDPSTSLSFYRPVRDFLRTQAGPFRVEVPMTQNKWESAYVAAEFPIARGWERQLDRERNGLFYRPHLDPAAYEAWLRDNGVRYVAVPDLPIGDFDDAAINEVALIRSSGVPALHQVWAGGRWHVYVVAGAPTLVDGPGRMVRLTASTFTVVADRAAPLLVRVRWSDQLTVDGTTPACVEPSPDGWTIVRPERPGPVSLSAELSLDHDSRCRS